MTAALLERERDVRNAVRSAHDEMDLPKGLRAEIIGGQIAVSASPFGKHAFIVKRIDHAVGKALPEGYDVFENTTLEEPEADRYIPDLAAWPVLLLSQAEDQWVFPASDCVFAVEVTSPRQEARDRIKAHGYARGGVPIYLLVDRSSRTCVVYTDPASGAYRTTTVFKFGDAVTFSIPGGSEAVIDTSDF